MADTTGIWGPATIASAVVMNPNTGEVYSLVSIPTFDNNIFADSRDRAAELEALSKNSSTFPFLNKALSPAAPGSTFKIVTAAAGLMEGSITPSTSYYIGCRLVGKARTTSCTNTMTGAATTRRWTCGRASRGRRTCSCGSPRVATWSE